MFKLLLKPQGTEAVKSRTLPCLRDTVAIKVLIHPIALQKQLVKSLWRQISDKK